MSFVTIGETHYNIENIACFGHFNSSVWVKCVGDREDEITTHSDPDKTYYRALCNAAGVSPCKEVK